MPFDLIKLLLSFVKGSNIYKTVGKTLHTIGVSCISADGNDTGDDDLAGGLFVAIGDAFDKYGDNSSNLHGNIVDAVIAGATEYRAQMVRTGKIPPVS